MTRSETGAVVWPTAMLPYVPPTVHGEWFGSWVDRVAASNSLPLGLLLNAMRLMEDTHHDFIPSAYGIALSPEDLRAISEVTRWPESVIAATLLTAYDGGPLNFEGLDLVSCVGIDFTVSF